MTYKVRSRLYGTHPNDAYPSPYPPPYPEEFQASSNWNAYSTGLRIKRIQELLRPAMPQRISTTVAVNRIPENIARTTNEKAHRSSVRMRGGNEKRKELERFKTSHLSSIVEATLSKLVGKDQLDPVIGDLQERSLAILTRSGNNKSAQKWYRRQLLKSIPPLFWAWLKRISGLEAIYRRIGR